MAIGGITKDDIWFDENGHAYKCYDGKWHRVSTVLLERGTTVSPTSIDFEINGEVFRAGPEDPPVATDIDVEDLLF